MSHITAKKTNRIFLYPSVHFSKLATDVMIGPAGRKLRASFEKTAEDRRSLRLASLCSSGAEYIEIPSYSIEYM